MPSILTGQYSESMAPPSSPDTREQILHSAAELFSSQNYATVSVDVLARKAGITKMTVYHYYKSKDSILLACLRDRLAQREAVLDERFRRKAATPAALLEFFAWMEEWAAKNGYRGCAFVKAVNEAAEHLPEVRTVAGEAKTLLRERMKRMARECRLPHGETLAEELALLLEGAQSLSFVEQNGAPIRNAKRAASKLIAQAQQGSR